MSRGVVFSIVLGVVLALPAYGIAGHRHRGGGRGCGNHGECCGRCEGCGHGAGGKRGARMGGDADFAADRELFHYLLDNREQIRREVSELPDGVVTLTESDDPKIVAGIREHVASMYARLKEERPIHRRDPLFAALFDHAEAIGLEMEETPKGLRVKETSDDPYVASLIREHAKVVSAFLEHGHAEVRRNHEPPAKPAAPAEPAAPSP